MVGGVLSDRRGGLWVRSISGTSGKQALNKKNGRWFETEGVWRNGWTMTSFPSKWGWIWDILDVTQSKPIVVGKMADRGLWCQWAFAVAVISAQMLIGKKEKCDEMWGIGKHAGEKIVVFRFSGGEIRYFLVPKILNVNSLPQASGTHPQPHQLDQVINAAFSVARFVGRLRMVCRCSGDDGKG